MKSKNKIIQYVEITIFLFIVFVGLKIIACMVPDERVQPNIKDSITYMMEEGDYPTTYVNAEYNLYSQRADNYTDVIFLNVAYNMRQSSKLEAVACDYRGVAGGDSGVEQAFNMINAEKYDLVSYGRQWFGSVAILRILLGIFTYPQIRVLFQYAFYILLGITVLLIAKKIDYKIAGLFMVLMSVISIDVVAASINLAGAFFCLLLGIILTCTLYQRGFSKYMIMYIVGALTAYFDLFSLPFVTVMVGMFILYIDYKNDVLGSFKKGFMELVGLAIAWLSGYVILWMTKWAFASVMGKSNVFKNALEEIKMQSVNKGISWGPDTTMGYITQSIQLCFENMFPINFLKMASIKMGILPVMLFVLLIIFVLIVYWIRHHKPIKACTFSALMLIVAAFPYICCAVMHTHAYVHFWMWFRMQIITWMAMTLAFTESIGGER